MFITETAQPLLLTQSEASIFFAVVIAIINILLVSVITTALVALEGARLVSRLTSIKLRHIHCLPVLSRHILLDEILVKKCHCSIKGIPQFG